MTKESLLTELTILLKVASEFRSGCDSLNIAVHGDSEAIAPKVLYDKFVKLSEKVERILNSVTEIANDVRGMKENHDRLERSHLSLADRYAKMRLYLKNDVMPQFPPTKLKEDT